MGMVIGMAYHSKINYLNKSKYFRLEILFIIFYHVLQFTFGVVSSSSISSSMATAVPSFSNQIRETVVIPASSDVEKEIKKMQDKALREYQITEISIIKNVCPEWEKIGCKCHDKFEDLINLTCRNVKIENVATMNWPMDLYKLELSNNNITSLPRKSFDLPYLRELSITNNIITNIDDEAFINLIGLKKLIISSCRIKNINNIIFTGLPNLVFMQLTENLINVLGGEVFQTLKQLKNLYLDSNKLKKVPTDALSHVNVLETLNLGSNELSVIRVGDFPILNGLLVLILKRNKITDIPIGALLTMKSLEILNLDDNLLTVLPPDLIKLTHLQELFLSGNRIKILSENLLPKTLSVFEMKTNPLVEIEENTFHNMSKLRKLILSDSKNLDYLPSFIGCDLLDTLWIDRAKLKELPESICKTSPRLKSLELKSNQFKSIPKLHDCRNLKMLDLSGNRISTIHGTPFRGLSSLQDLVLSQNEIETIPKDAFQGLIKIQLLDLEGNSINYIHIDAFKPFTQIKDLNLGDNVFPELPIEGLKSLNHLKTFNNPKLKDFPPPSAFPKIQTLVLSYAYHCCAFLPFQVNPDTTLSPISETVIILPPGSNQSISHLKEYLEKMGIDYDSLSSIPSYEEYMEGFGSTKPTEIEIISGSIQCLPLPDPFLPCQDLFDWWTLRCGVWVVFLLAMLGNGTVVFVLVFSRSKMDVPRFLVCNLAAADFFMGIYLGLLAVVDASTLGEFRMYAIPWQMSAGCQLAGFLAVLSSELSVYTLAVITLERNYAITHAMHLNKRLSLRHAGYIMAIGWMFALTMALLPLIGVSDYRKFAVCLPFETTTGPGSLAYVIFLMFINGVAFLILMGCYLKMYCAIRGSQAWNSNDSRIAKRMALLVFTDFLCWSPIAFFSLTAIFGLHLISLEQAKVFTVFILPLNSCCNPFLYAILTKQFKKDCVLICKAIEESRVTRGIGRCRHSSNFSNRQTPANTNSLVERSSRDLMPPLLPGQTCACAKLLDPANLHRKHSSIQNENRLRKAWRRIWCRNKRNENRRGKRSDQYAHQIAEIQQKQHKRAGSMSSSENFSSSRSDSWRHGPPHHYCGMQLRKLDPRWRHSSWLITRKTSQDSNLSSSRNDSSGSNTTQSTSTWRMSRSSTSTPIPQLSFNSSMSRQSIPGGKPRLVRQSAVTDDSQDLSCSPPRLSVRFLPTIPSAADSSVQLDEESSSQLEREKDSGNNSCEKDCEGDNSSNNTVNGNNGVSVSSSGTAGAKYYAVLQSGTPLTILSSPKDKTKPP